MDIQKVLELHAAWLNNREEGAKADLSGAYLSRADLSGADLSWADLSRADLSGADLSGAYLFRANLSGADLSGAYLSRANLSGADLSGADLSRADLSGADLSGADLSGANLSGAYLSRANLSGAKQRVIQIKGSKHNIVAIDDDVRVGCQRFPLAIWLKEYKKIGKKNSYSDAEVKEYGLYLKTIKAILNLPR